MCSSDLFTSFSYDVDAPTMKDPTWGFPEIPFSYDGIKTDVNRLLNEYEKMKQVMKQMGAMTKSGKMPNMGGMGAMGAMKNMRSMNKMMRQGGKRGKR